MTLCMSKSMGKYCILTEPFFLILGTWETSHTSAWSLQNKIFKSISTYIEYKIAYVGFLCS